MVLFTKCMFADISPDDGTRISVMSRHTLNDGKTPDSRITEDSYNLWMKELAPKAYTVGAWYREEISWELFGSLYLLHMRSNPINKSVGRLARLAVSQDITLLCVEEDAEECHRGMLTKECEIYEPTLSVVHR